LKRRFNYTGRKKIPREKISIILNKDGDLVRSFDATLYLNDMALPSDAKVYIDAYHKTESSRFDFGTIGNTIPPRDTKLGSPYVENLNFRILVVDESGQHGRILAHIDGIKPAADTERKPILPVEFDDLGQQVWHVEYTGDEGAPVLFLNETIPNIRNIAKANPQFIIYVYPAVIREVLSHMILEGVDSPSDPSIDWHGDWLLFARRILPGEGPPEVLDTKDGRFSLDDAKEWIDQVVEEFCASRKEWREYLKQLHGQEI